MTDTLAVLYRPDGNYEVGQMVYKPGIGFNAVDLYGMVVGFDILGGPLVQWAA